MKMSIIISQNGKGAKRVEQSNFALEDHLQEYIYANPESIPLYDINEDVRLFIAAREFSTNSGPIDALGFDASGNIYVVETKLFKNPDKRTVVAQALDYGASLWRHATDFDQFLAQLDIHTQKQFSKPFASQYTDFFGLDDATESLLAIKNNLSDGSIKFVVLMDKLHDPLKDLIVFVNQNSKFDIYAVELEYYKHDSFEIVIPKLFGSEVKKEVASTKGARSSVQYISTDEATFWLSVEELSAKDEITPYLKAMIIELSELFKLLAEKTNGRITYFRKQSPTKNAVTLMLRDSDEKVTGYIDSDSNLGFYMWGKEGVQVEIVQELLNVLIEKRLMGRTDKHRKATQWFINPSFMSTGELDIRKFVEIFKDIAANYLK